nr:e3 ubiquitin-protein ligase ring1-like protein [Ipomoea trifida]
MSLYFFRLQFTARMKKLTTSAVIGRKKKPQSIPNHGMRMKQLTKSAVIGKKLKQSSLKLTITQKDEDLLHQQDWKSMETQGYCPKEYIRKLILIMKVRELCRKEVKMSGLVMALTLDHLFDHDTALAALGPENSGGVKVAAPELATVMACDGVCTVCMEGFRSGIGGKQAPCGHIFHANCILKWLSLHNSCPLCRSPITGKLPL